MSNAPHTWPRLFTPFPLKKSGESIPLDEEQTHYLLRVLRAQEGQNLRLFNGHDGEWTATLAAPPSKKKEGARLVLQDQRVRQRAETDLWLCPAPLKKAAFEFLVQKATELGISTLQPVLTDRAHVREINNERLTAIAREAAEQSERLSVPTILPLRSLKSLLETWPKERHPFICAEFGAANPIASALTASPTPKPPAALFTGPEGGFTEQELATLTALPRAVPLRLGPRILRADTAALAALACWQALCGDWQNADHKGERS